MWNSRWRSLTPSWRTILIRHPAQDLRCFASKQERSGGEKQRWSPDEDETILQLRQDGKMVEDILDHLPGRSLAAVESRMYGALRETLIERGLVTANRPDLSASDVAKMRRLRSQGVPWSEVLRDYPGRHLRTVKRTLNSSENERAPGKRLQVPFEAWEDELLVRYRRDESLTWPDVFAKMSDRSPGSLHNRYRRLVRATQRTHIPSKKHFTQAEVKELIRLRDSGLGWGTIANQMGKQGSFGVRMRYIKEKYFSNIQPKAGPWSQEEDEQLRALHRGAGKEWIERAVPALGRSPSAINYRAWQLRVHDARTPSIKSDAGAQSNHPS